MAELGQRGPDFGAGGAQDARQLHRVIRWRLDPVEPQEVSGLLAEVDDVVDMRGQPVSVVRVEGSRCLLKEMPDQVVRDAVALVFAIDDLLPAGGRYIWPGAHQIVQQRRRARGVLAGVAEEVVDLGVSRGACEEGDDAVPETQCPAEGAISG